MEQNKENFFVVIPHSVLTDKTLSDLDKLVFGEISALCNKNGFCTAKNDYIAEIFNKNIRTIQRSIEALTSSAYIKVELTANTQQGTDRRIYLSLTHFDPMTKMSSPHDKNVMTPMTKIAPPIYENIKENTSELVKNHDNFFSSKTQTPEPVKKTNWATCPVRLNLHGLRDKYQEAEDAHDECNLYLRGIEKARRRGFADYNQQMFKLHNLLKAGYDFDELDALVVKVERKFGKHNWDFERLVKWADKEPQKGGTNAKSKENGIGLARGASSFLDSI